MNIVWLTPEIPYPQIGGRNGVYNRIVQLSKYNNIYLFSIAYSEEEKSTSSEMMNFCKEVHYYNRNKSRIKNIIKSIFVPYSVASRTIRELKCDLMDVINKNKIDAIIIDFPNMALNIKGIDKKIYITLNEHNIEFERMRSMGKIRTISCIRRLMYIIESYRLEIYESWLYRSDILNSITFFSKKDKEKFELRWKGVNSELRVFPLGGNARTQESNLINDKNLLFIGRLDKVAIPNVEAALWMAYKVFPLIIQDIPEAKLIIAGANPSKEISDLSNYKNIVIIPNYISMSDVYSLSNIVVLPLLSGGGVKGKLLEASAFRKIIVSTDHGIEGTDFRNNEHVLVANNEQDFANACISALKNTDDYMKMAEKSHQLFAEKYEWGTIGANYNEFLNNRVIGCSQ